MASPFTPSSIPFSQASADLLYLLDSLADAKGDLIGASAADTWARLAVGANTRMLLADSAQSLGFSWGGAGLAPLFDSTLGGVAAGIDSGAGGFSTSYAHLLVVFLARTTEAVGPSAVNFLLNNDSAGNYDRQSVQGVNVTASAAAAAASSLLVNVIVPGSSAAASAFGGGLLLIPAYSQTTAHKVGIVVGGVAEATAANNAAQLKTGRWRNTAAVTRVAMNAQANNLDVGSRMTVYGVGV